METQLARNEQLIKTWHYSNVKTKRGAFSRDTDVRELTVTSKRIISSQTNKNHTSVDEIYLKDVKNVSGSYGKKANLLLLIIFMFLAVASLVAAIAAQIYYLLIGTAIFVLVGILLYVFSKRAVFTLHIDTYNVQNKALDISIGTFSRRKGLRGNKSARVTRILVDYESSKEIVNTLGAIVLENRE